MAVNITQKKEIITHYVSPVEECNTYNIKYSCFQIKQTQKSESHQLSKSINLQKIQERESNLLNSIREIQSAKFRNCRKNNLVLSMK